MGECFYALDAGRGFATLIHYLTAGEFRSHRFYALDVGRGFATAHKAAEIAVQPSFYALDVGRGFATSVAVAATGRTNWPDVSMPSMSGGALQPRPKWLKDGEHVISSGFYALDVGRALQPWFFVIIFFALVAIGFYALDVGRGFATVAATTGGNITLQYKFLCPRCRAGLCNCGSPQAY